MAHPAGCSSNPSPRRLVDLARLQPLVHALGRHELPSDDLFPLFEDERGDIWLSARLPDRLKLLRWRRATDDFQIYGAKDGLADGTARPAVVAGLAGQLFVGFEEAGLFVYRDGRFSAILDGARRMGVMRLHVDRLGRLWIFRTDGAVSRIDDLSGYGVVRDEMVQRSLMGARVRCVVEDARGHLFMGTASGVVEVDPGTGGTWRYTTAEGLAQNEVLSALVSRRGEVWFGTVSGVSRLQAVPPRRTRHVPEVYITTVRVNAGARLVSALGEREVPGLTLEPDERHVSIDYFGLTFAPGEPLQYQYRLDGADRDWSAPTPLRRVNYAQLSPGTYRFQVRAVTLSGTSGAEPASLRFRILAPVWRRWWFITAAGAIAVGLGTMLHRYRVAQLVAIERVRTRIATDLHDDIGASLSQIAILSELARGEADTRPETADTLGRIAATSRELVESMGDIVWSINPARDRVGDLLQRMRRFASDTFTGRNIDFGFQASEVGRELALAADLRREVLLIFKESVNNIVRHARCRRAEIDVRIEGEALVVSVADDGQGLPTQGDPLDGHGLPSMRERAARLGGSLVIDSSPGRGTTLVLRVPLRRAGRTS